MKLHKYEENHEQDRRFDEAVRQKVAQDHATPPDGLWARVAEELEDDAPRRSLDARWWNVAAAVSLLIVSGISIGLYLGANETSVQQSRVQDVTPGSMNTFLSAPSVEELAKATTPSESFATAPADSDSQEEHAAKGTHPHRNTSSPATGARDASSAEQPSSSRSARPQAAASRDGSADKQPHTATSGKVNRSGLPAMKASAGNANSSSSQLFEADENADENPDTLPQQARKMPCFHLIAVEKMGPVEQDDSLASLRPDSLTGSDLPRGVREAGGSSPRPGFQQGRLPGRNLPHFRNTPHHDSVKGVGQ